MKILIAGITSDIGSFFAKKSIAEGHTVFGTYRSEPSIELKRTVIDSGGALIPCDFADSRQIDNAVLALSTQNFKWDLFLSAVGILSPVGKFADIVFDDFEENIYVNSISQFRFLRGILRMRNKNAKVFFITSRGIHDPFPEHAAYCLSKLMLVKMCEILDDEFGDCSFIALNPGYIPTKIVSQDLGAKNLPKDVIKARMDRVCDFIKWAYTQNKAVVSGRNFFIEYDPWKSLSIVEELIENADKFKLRRAKDNWNEKEKRFE